MGRKMCDGSITTMVSNQSRMRYCWIVYSNSQNNERVTATETRSSTIASSSSNTRTLIDNVLNAANPTTFRNTTKPPRENIDGSSEQKKTDVNATTVDEDDLASVDVHMMLEPHLRPAPPDPNSDLSKQIFEEHKQLAKEYLKIHTEIAYVTKHRDEILSRLDPVERQERLDICNKQMEKEELLKFQANLKRQLELIRMNTRPPPVNVPAPPVSTPSQMPFTRQTSNTNTTANEDGWVMVSSQNESDA